jgi:hypothetical protein
MKYHIYHKGFVGIGVIVAIVAALVVGGGVVYYATQPSVPESNYIPTDQNGDVLSVTTDANIAQSDTSTTTTTTTVSVVSNQPSVNSGGGQNNCQSINTNTAYQLATNADIYLEPDFGVSFVQAIDLTNDGVPECIFSGNGGNNGMAFILRNNVVMNQKNQNNTIAPVQLLSVGRVMVSEEYELLPQHNGYYTISKSLSDETSGSFACNQNGVKVYTWNNLTNLFEWNQALTTSYTTSLC